MDTPDPIDAYLREFEHELRARGMARRRILAELRAHLLDAVEAEQCRGAEEGVAAQRAVLRFGLVAETARQFNCLAARRGAVLRRVLVPWIAAVAFTSLATATVWASHPAASPSQPRSTLGHQAQPKGCSERPVGLGQRARRGTPRSSKAPIRQTRSACRVPDVPGR
jgi:hypothetical protein